MVGLCEFKAETSRVMRVVVIGMYATVRYAMARYGTVYKVFDEREMSCSAIRRAVNAT